MHAAQFVPASSAQERAHLVARVANVGRVKLDRAAKVGERFDPAALPSLNQAERQKHGGIVRLEPREFRVALGSRARNQKRAHSLIWLRIFWSQASPPRN